MTRRDFGKIAAAVLPAASALNAGPNSTVGGVKLGAITYSFHDLKRTAGQDSVDECISNLLYAGCQYCELMSNDVEPARQAREALRTWRIETPTEHFEAVRKKFNDAGITIFAYTVNYNAQYSDEEIANSFRHAKALGTNIVASSTTVSMAKRIVPFAEKAGMNVAFHGHTNVKDPEQFAAPENFAAAIAMSPNYRINLDIGHFVAAGFEPVGYIRENHAHITHLHVKDKKKNDGPNMPWGQGDTPYREVLLLLKNNRYDIAAMTEMAYQVTVPTREEVKKNMDDMRAILS
jgi:sugar phosphate isomerase/epimerase